MTEKINEQNLENVNGGYATTNTRVVANIPDGYLAVRTATSFQYENEIGRLYNGDVVQITGPYVPGTGINGTPATYVMIYSPRLGISGYVNAAYLA